MFSYESQMKFQLVDDKKKSFLVFLYLKEVDFPLFFVKTIYPSFLV